MDELKFKVQKRGNGYQFYLDGIKMALFNLNEGDEFQASMRTKKGKKIITLEAVDSSE